MEEKEEFCQKCKKSLRGEPIPEESRKHFNGTHFSLKMGIYDETKDKTTHYLCPFCNYTWER